MKKILVIMMAVTMGLMTGCGETAKVDNQEPKTEVTVPVEEIEEVETTEEREEVTPLDLSWIENDSSLITTGAYVVGDDIAANNYIVTCTDKYLDFAVFENAEKYSAYRKAERFTGGEESDAIEANSKLSEFMYKDEYKALNLVDGNILLIKEGIGSLGDGSNQSLDKAETICEGIYEPGMIKPGKYLAGCLTADYNVGIIIFDADSDYQQFEKDDHFTVGDYGRDVNRNAKYDVWLKPGEFAYVSIDADDVVMVSDQALVELYSYSPAWADGSLIKAGKEAISEVEDVETDEKAEENESESVDEKLIRPEFKAAMDEYEKFYDEYCDFMKKYTSSTDPMDSVNMLGDYSKMLLQMEEMDEKFEEWDSKDMTTAETAYYIDVTARIQKKLLSVAQ